MLTDAKLRTMKPKERAYKVGDRDGLYVAVSVKGAISFRYNYSLHGRQETVTFGRYGGAGGMTLAEARERLGEAKKLIAAGISPAQQKTRERDQLREARRFGDWAESWLENYDMAESTRDMRRACYLRELKGKFGNRLLSEITPEDLRALTDAIVARGAKATAVHAREILMLVFNWARERGEKVSNPADDVRPSSIATFKARDRYLERREIALALRYLEYVGTTPMIRAAVRLLLLTMVRKSELTDATWDEINFTDALWTIPAQRMKRRTPHLVPLPTQALDLLMALKTFAGGSRYVLPSRYDPAMPMSKATLNRVTTLAYECAQRDGAALAPFTVHDLRRTASTLLHEAGYNTDWIEKQLAHEQRGVRAVYNKAEYLEQRRVMLQDWANMIDGCVADLAATA